MSSKQNGSRPNARSVAPEVPQSEVPFIESLRARVEDQYRSIKLGSGSIGGCFGSILCHEIHSGGEHGGGLHFTALAEKWGIPVSVLGELIADHCKRLEPLLVVRHGNKARHAPQPEAVELTNEQAERIMANAFDENHFVEANKMVEPQQQASGVERYECETCGIGFYLPSGRCDHCNCRRTDVLAPPSGARIRRFTAYVDYGMMGSESYEVVTAADHDRLLAERDAEIAELRRQSSHWYEEFSRIAHQFRVAVDPSNVQKLNPEGTAKLAVEFRTRAEAAEAKCAELEKEVADEERRGDLHADLNKRVAEAIENPFTGPGSSWHDLPEKVANLKSEYEYQRDAVMRGIEHCRSFSERLTAATTRAEAAEAKVAELENEREVVRFVLEPRVIPDSLENMARQAVGDRAHLLKERDELRDSKKLQHAEMQLQLAELRVVISND